MRAALATALLCASCAQVRYLDQPTIWREPDDKPIAAPKERDLSIHWSAIRDIIFIPADRFFDLEYGVEAENVNALDELGDSTWWHDLRRGSPEDGYRPRPFTRNDVLVGPTTPEDAPVLPLTVWKTKGIGATPGFAAKDARGIRYLVKLDGNGAVGLATSVEIVSSRLAWACGYFVPELYLLDVDPADLKWKDGVKFKDSEQQKVPYTKAMHDKVLATAPRIDGKIRILASRWLEGQSIGPFPYAGKSHDDPNDLFAHENRRDLRAFSIFTAWVNDVDTLQNNTLDMYEGAPGKGHVVHYQQDVGGAFGTWAAADAAYWMGYEGYFRISHIFASLLSLGFYTRLYERDDFEQRHDERVRKWPVLAGFDAKDFEPRRWEAAASNPAFDRLTARDGYWGAKRIAGIGADALRGAVDSGLYPKPVADHLFDILWERRRKILDAYFRGVAALDYFTVTDGGTPRLCFDDLFAKAGLHARSRYSVTEQRSSYSITWTGPLGCVELPAKNGYRVIELGVERDERGAKKVRVHFTETDGSRHIVGVQR